MARPTKQGIDYFPVDVQFDDNVELFLAEHGAEGLGILVTIWQLIYQNNGYYINNNDDLILLIRRRCMADISIIKVVISSAIGRNIFSKHKNKNYKILTSKGIQERYFLASKKKKSVNVDGNYICNGVMVGGNGVYSDGNATKEEVKEEVKEETGNKKQLPLPCLNFSKDFYVYLSENGGKKKPTVQDIDSGAETIDKLIRIDGFDLDSEIIPALRWGIKDSFWSGQVRSLKPLRDKKRGASEHKFTNLFNQYSAKNIKTAKSKQNMTPRQAYMQDVADMMTATRERENGSNIIGDSESLDGPDGALSRVGP